MVNAIALRNWMEENAPDLYVYPASHNEKTRINLQINGQACSVKIIDLVDAILMNQQLVGNVEFSLIMRGLHR